MKTNIDFASLPDTEAARLMAEKDGWRVEMQGEYWSGVIYHASNANTGEQFTSRTKDFVWKQVLKNTNYPHSLDAAVAWLGRMGLRWERQLVNANYNDGVVIVYGTYSESFTESPDCPTSRALCNAGWAAVQAREASNG